MNKMYFSVKGLFLPLYFYILSKCLPMNVSYFCNKEKISPLGNNVDYEVEDQDEMCRVVIFVRMQMTSC